jgi:uncharacterized membrane protein HdeD (DUF308 family)
MRASSLTAIGAILGILIGAVIFAAAIITRVHGATLLGLALIAAGVILACQPDSSPQQPRQSAH